MKYTIFNIEPTRQHYVEKIEWQIDNKWDRIYTDCIDARDDEEFERARNQYPYPIHFDARRGHMGIWYTVLNSLFHAPLVTFEDDALLQASFTSAFDIRAREIPEDFDFFALFLPRDSDHLFKEEEHGVSEHVSRTYQRYGGVSMYYSKKGAEKIRSLVRRDGFFGQYDDTLYQYAKDGALEGYCSKPKHSDLVYITGLEKSIVQETEYA